MYYTYTARETSVDLGSVNFTHLTGLRNLTINTLFDSFVFDRTLDFPASMQSVFQPLSNLTSLKISITWTMSEPLPAMFSFLKNLEVLDLSYTRLINYTNLQQSLKGLKNNDVLHRVILRNTQTFENLVNGLSFNLSYFLEPIAHCPLQHLDLSYNSLKSIYPGLIRFAPNVTEIIVTNNFFLILDSAFFLEVLLHPKLEVADFSRQGYGISASNIQTAMFPTESSQSLMQKIPRSEMTSEELPMLQISPKESIMSKTPPKKSSILETSPDEFPMKTSSKRSVSFLKKQAEATLALKIKELESIKEPPMDPLKNANFSFVDDDCINIRAGNVCAIFKPQCRPLFKLFRENHAFFCEVLAYYVKKSFAGIPCDYIPRIDDLVDEDCGACFVFPSMGNLRQLFLREDNIYDQNRLPTQMINTKICFHPNKIEKADLSYNYPLGYPDIDVLFQLPITGFNNLKEGKLAGSNLMKPYYNLSATFPNIMSIDFSQNKLTLENYKEKYFIGPPTVTYFNLASNAIRKTPEDTLRTMHALETLNLDNNHLSEFSMNLTYLPNLRNLSLQSNLIKSFSKRMMVQFNEHARKSNQSITIDLQHNILLCTCNELDFVHWIQNAKTHSLDFKGIEDLVCLNSKSSTMKILEVELNHINCLSARAIVGISVSGALLLAGMIAWCGITLYRKRWWLRYRYFTVTKMYKQRQQQQEAQRNYEYDAFVSYNRRDELWINTELQPKLEDEFGLKLCLHQRDFELGGHIMEHITSSIANSRKTLLILSPNFLASNWCHWEMNLAHCRLGITGQDVLMLAILSPMSKAGFLV